jgi:AcrR family transcriptional regulator
MAKRRLTAESDAGLSAGAQISALRERQQMSREEVLDAAAEAFIARGYAATSIDDVADRLGCTKGRVYHYFRTKGELFLGVHRKALDLAMAAIVPVMEHEGSARQRLSDMCVAHARLMIEQASFMRLAAQHAEMNLATEGRTREDAVSEIFALRASYEGYFEKVIQQGVAAGQFRQVDAALMAKAALGTLNWMSMWYQPGKPSRTKADARHIPQEFATFIVAGLLADDRAPAEP